MEINLIHQNQSEIVDSSEVTAIIQRKVAETLDNHKQKCEMFYVSELPGKAPDKDLRVITYYYKKDGRRVAYKSGLFSTFLLPFLREEAEKRGMKELEGLTYSEVQSPFAKKLITVWANALMEQNPNTEVTLEDLIGNPTPVSEE